MFIKLKKITKRFYDKVLFRDLEMLVSADRKIGLIGDNGSGKTTFLKIIAGIDIPNFGQIEVSPPDTKFAYIMSDQDLLSSYDYPYEFLLPEELSELYEKIFVQASEDQDNFERFDELHGYSVLNDLEKQLKIFGVSIQDLSTTFEHLSSGERLKMQFAKISAHPYEALLLDEPTATLDKEGKAFLYDFLSKWHSFCMIASHDRKLLNEFCKQVLVFEEGTVKSYSGNYDFYVQAVIDEKIRIDEANGIFQKKVNDLTEETDNLTEDINERVHTPRDNDKSAFNYKISRKNSKNIRKIDVLRHKIEKIKDNIAERAEEKKGFEMKLNLTPPKAKILIEAKDISIKVADKVLIENASFTIKNKDRIIIEGKNGIGKSSLIKTIFHDKDLDSGTIEKNPELQIGYYEQTLNPGMLLIKAEDYVIGEREWIKGENRINDLADYLEFPKTLLYKSLNDLSEGERAKLKFIKVFSYNPNFLILDEPTNFLDVRTLEKIQKIIIETRVPLIMVSHDDEFNQSLNLNQSWKIKDRTLIKDSI